MQKSRIWELDAIRGFCILCVIVIHFIFDLQYFAGLDLQLPALYLFIQNNGGVLFILVSGICATLGSRSFRRGIIVFCSGLLISCVIYGMIALNMAGSDAKILFGILHFLGFAMMIYPLLKKLPTVFLALTGAIMIVAGYILLQRVFDTPVIFTGCLCSASVIPASLRAITSPCCPTWAGSWKVSFWAEPFIKKRNPCCRASTPISRRYGSSASADGTLF